MVNAAGPRDRWFGSLARQRQQRPTARSAYRRMVRHSQPVTTATREPAATSFIALSSGCEGQIELYATFNKPTRTFDIHQEVTVDVTSRGETIDELQHVQQRSPDLLLFSFATIQAFHAASSFAQGFRFLLHMGNDLASTLPGV